MSTFVDTGAWFARMVPTDPNHQAVIDWFRKNSSPVFTSDYVIDETLTLLRARGETQRAIEFGRAAFELSLFTIYKVNDQDLQSAWLYFRNEPKRNWSFTDCTSRVVMERFHAKSALTFDSHFSEFGFVTVEP
jgi:predicted nucleic acid-binding protein